MKQQPTEAAIRRIRQMESLFDLLQQPEARNSPDFQTQLQTLTAYYESGLWLQDYRMDELGLLPDGLKRGVLSEDGVYHFLTEVNFQ